MPTTRYVMPASSEIEGVLATYGRGERSPEPQFSTGCGQRSRGRFGDDAQLAVEANGSLQPCCAKNENKAPGQPLVVSRRCLPVSNGGVKHDALIG